MKSSLSVSLLFLITLFVNSCTSNSPENTATNFFNYLEEEKYKEARAISTENTHEIIDFLQTAQNIAGELEKEEKKGISFDCSCEQEGEEAICDCCENGDKEACRKVTVIQKDGQWLVDMKKENGF